MLLYTTRHGDTVARQQEGQCVRRVFQLWKDVSDHSCQLGNYAVHNFQLDAKKFEFRKGNPFTAIFLKIIKGKHGFYNGRKIENFEIPFLVRKMYQYWSRIYQKMRNSNIWGGMFSEKSRFCQYFHEIIMIY